jgi:hypothetical protein
VEASGSLSVAETIEVENPSVSSLLTTVQKIWGSKRRKLQRYRSSGCEECSSREDGWEAGESWYGAG